MLTSEYRALEVTLPDSEDRQHEIQVSARLLYEMIGFAIAEIQQTDPKSGSLIPKM